MAGLGQQILIEAMLVPATIAVLGAWLGARRFGHRPVVVAGALALGFLVAFELIRGLDAAWPRAASDKLPLAVLLGLGGSLIAGHGRPLAGALVALACPVLLITARPLAAGEVAGPLAVLVIGLVLWRGLDGRVAPARRAWLLVAMALGLAGTAVFARTLLIGELALAGGAVALAAAVRPARSAEGLLPVASLLIGIGATLASFSEAPVPALLLIALIPPVGWLSPLLARRSRVREPLLTTILPLIPAALAAVWTRWVHGPPLYF